MLGTFVYYHCPLWNFHHQYGIVVYVNEDSYGISIPKFKGDYLNVLKTSKDIRVANELKDSDKLSIIGTFGDWWTIQHKSLFHEILVQCLRSKPLD